MKIDPITCSRSRQDGVKSRPRCEAKGKASRALTGRALTF